MKIVTGSAKMQELSRQLRGAGVTVALVPTMGFLHEGHLALVRRAQECADFVVVSIFVNPTQFNSAEDFEKYPRDDMADRALLEHEGVDCLFVPSAEDVYPAGAATRVSVAGITSGLCGAHRPGHFDGVATVVSALFNMVLPDIAVFGRKDFQQLQMIRRMVRDLHFPVRIVEGETVREADGLALSSRNARLAPGQRAVAPAIHEALVDATRAYAAGERDAAGLTATARAVLAREPQLEVEYLEVVDAESLAPVVRADGRSVMAVAAWLGPVRLIDNVVLAETASAVPTEAGDAGATIVRRAEHDA